MYYFKEVLPYKKESLEDIYSQMLKYLKNSHKGLKAGDVEEVQWWLGDLFTLLCENKELVDERIYEQIVDLKNAIMESSTRFLLFYTRFNDKKNLEKKMKNIINVLERRISELKLYLLKIRKG